MTLEKNATIKLNVKARGAEVALKRVAQEIGKVGDKAKKSSTQTETLTRSLQKAAHRGNLLAVAMQRVGGATFSRASNALEQLHRRFRAFDATTRRAAIRGSLSARGYVTMREGLIGTGRAMRVFGGVASQAMTTARSLAAGLSTTGFAVAAMAAPFAYAIRQSALLEEAMARVGAVSGASSTQLASMGRQARLLGAQTSYTAEQVAEAMETLASAGYDTPAIQAAIPSVLNLARGNSISTEDAGSLLASTTRSFRLNIGDESNARAVADLISQTAAASSVSADTLRETLRYSGSTFAALGDGSQGSQQAMLREQLMLAGLLGNQGIQGSVAGTALKNIQLRFTGEGREGLNDLGLDSFQGGNYRGTSTIIGDLRQALMGRSQEGQLAALHGIAGRQAAPALQALLNTDPREFGRLSRALEDADGAAERLRVTMENTFMGDWELFTSAIDGLAISIGDQLMPATRSMIQGITDAVSTFTNMRESFLSGSAPGNEEVFSGNTGLHEILTLGFSGLLEVAGQILDTMGADEASGAAFSSAAALISQMSATQLDRINRERDIAIGNVGREQAAQTQARELRVAAAQDLQIGAGSSAQTLLARFDSLFGQEDVTGEGALAVRERIASMGASELTAEQAATLRQAIIGSLVQDQQAGNATSEQEAQQRIAEIYSGATLQSGIVGGAAIGTLEDFQQRTGFDTQFTRDGIGTTRDAATERNRGLRDRALANVRASQEESTQAEQSDRASAAADASNDLHGLSRESQEAVRQLIALGVAAEQATSILRAAGRAPTGAPTGESTPGAPQ